VDLLGGFTPSGARLRIIASDARALVAALARDDAPIAVPIHSRWPGPPAALSSNRGSTS
jgi:hypothetical protein